jgi:hypothetical protein
MPEIGFEPQIRRIVREDMLGVHDRQMLMDTSRCFDAEVWTCPAFLMHRGLDTSCCDDDSTRTLNANAHR